MLPFNLLPWRIQKARQRKRKFLWQCANILLIVTLFAIGFYIFLIFNINHQQTHNHYLQQKITSYQTILTKLEKIKHKRNNLIKFLKSLAKLQRQENQTIKVFNFFNQRLPPNTYYTAVNYTNNQLKLAGYTQNNIEINKLLEKLNKIQWHPKNQVKINKNKINVQYPYTFKLIINEL